MIARAWREARGVKWRTLSLEIRPFDWQWPGACWGRFFCSLYCGPLALIWETRWERGAAMSALEKLDAWHCCALEPLLSEALVAADRAMIRYPEPNYTITKVAEEMGEVVKAAVHCAEGRADPSEVRAEIVDAIAMLIRLYLEGDRVHGLPPVAGLVRSHAGPRPKRDADVSGDPV